MLAVLLLAFQPLHDFLAANVLGQVLVQVYAETLLSTVW